MEENNQTTSVVSGLAGQLLGLAEQRTTGLLVALTALAWIASVVLPSNSTKRTSTIALMDPIPFIYNAIQYLFFNEHFMIRVQKVFEHTSIAKFNFFTTPVFVVRGQRNIQTIFTSGHKLGMEQLLVKIFYPTMYRWRKEDILKFDRDRSGRLRVPAPGNGNEKLRPEERYWYNHEHIYTDLLGRGAGGSNNRLRPIAQYFRKCYARKLDERYALGEWDTIGLIDFCKGHIAESNTEALFGPVCLELNPDFIDAYWGFDSQIFPLVLALPRWLYATPYKKQERFFNMVREWIHTARENLDRSDPDSESDWEPNFGARLCREVVKWLGENGFSDQAAVGALGMLVFAMNSNTVPTNMWLILEVVRDPNLLRAVREEVATVYVTDPETGARTVDVDKLVKLPLMQSIFTETLRLHMNFNILRHVNEPVTIEGQTLGKASMVQAAMTPAHYDEADWGTAEHPASEFWAERHIKYVETRDDDGNVTRERVFALAGRPSNFFPFGGGAQICPGRYLAKHQVLASIALLVTKFDIETTWWTKLDGKPSDRPAKNDVNYSGSGAIPPDRDLKIRCKRVE